MNDLNINEIFALLKLIDATTDEELAVIFDNEDIDNFYEAKAWLERRVTELS
jgi:hypothetical protein